MDPIRGLMKIVWSLVGLLLLSAVCFSVLATQVGRPAGVEFWVGVALLGYIVWRVVSAARRLRGRQAKVPLKRPELPARAKWVGPRGADRKPRRW